MHPSAPYLFFYLSIMPDGLGKLRNLMGKENETFLMIFDVVNSCFWRNIFYTVIVCSHETPIFTCFLSGLFSSFFQHAKIIQNKFQLNSSKSTGVKLSRLSITLS
jgi:hypothetical protein